MKEVTINNCSVATDINWESPVHPVISRPHSDGANRSVQHGGVAGGAVRMEPTPDGVGSFLAAADLPTGRPQLCYSMERKMPSMGLFHNCMRFSGGGGEPHRLEAGRFHPSCSCFLNNNTTTTTTTTREGGNLLNDSDAVPTGSAFLIQMRSPPACDF